MSRHEGVSCDECLKGNFRGRRFKCLRCYDYDLCSSCYEGGASTARHPLEHPMQCILTRVDYDLYYGGDSGSGEQPQAFTCPYCGHMGFTESALQEHVSSQHAETSTEVICPVCAALPGGDPNHVTDDFTAHLTLEHRAPRDLDESSSVRHVRRMFHPGRGLGGPRARRTNMHFTSGSAGGLTSSSTSSSSSQSSSYTPSNREAMDPIAELLSQLSGVRRAAGGAGGAHPGGPSASQLQTQLTLQGAPRTPPETAARQAARRGNHTHTHHHHHPQNPSQHQHPPPPGTTALSSPAHAHAAAAAAQDHAPNCHGSSPFLLARLGASRPNEAEWQRAERSLFVQELLLSTLMHASSSSSSSSCASAAAAGGRRDFAAFGAGACVDALPLGVALERLELSSASLGVEPRPPPL